MGRTRRRTTTGDGGGTVQNCMGGGNRIELWIRNEFP